MKTTIERFEEKISPEPTSGCWLWMGASDRHGYGHATVGGRTVKAYRWLYEALRGPIPAGLQLDHLCRVPACVNPAHLEPVTNRENGRRGTAAAVNRARQLSVSHCPSGHPYSFENTRLHVTGRSRALGRLCRTCENSRRRKHQFADELRCIMA